MRLDSFVDFGAISVVHLFGYLFVYLPSFLTFFFPYTSFLLIYFLNRLLSALSISFFQNRLILFSFRSLYEATEPGLSFLGSFYVEV